MNSKKIMVVDDEGDTRSFLSGVLESEGYLVETHDNPFVALSKVRQFQPDLVILDYRMPQAEGTHLLPALREAAPEAKLLILTAYPDEGMEKEALESGACQVVRKPAELGDFLRTLRRHLGEDSRPIETASSGEVGN